MDSMAVSVYKKCAEQAMTRLYQQDEKGRRMDLFVIEVTFMVVSLALMTPRLPVRSVRTFKASSIQL